MALAGWAFSAVALVAIVALVTANLSLQSRSESSKAFTRMQHALALAAQPGSRVAVIVAPASGSSPSNGSTVPSGLAVIPPTGTAILVMQGLTPTAGNQVYEAWGIVGGRSPVPVGSFVVGSDGTGGLDALSMPAGGSLTIALTREPGPGATAPTLPIVAAGVATSG
jgi:hypothetical protein